MLSLWANWLQPNSQLNSPGVSFWLYRTCGSAWYIGAFTWLSSSEPGSKPHNRLLTLLSFSKWVFMLCFSPSLKYKCQTKKLGRKKCVESPPPPPPPLTSFSNSFRVGAALICPTPATWQIHPVHPESAHVQYNVHNNHHTPQPLKCHPYIVMHTCTPLPGLPSQIPPPQAQHVASHVSSCGKERCGTHISWRQSPLVWLNYTHNAVSLWLKVKACIGGSEFKFSSIFWKCSIIPTSDIRKQPHTSFNRITLKGRLRVSTQQWTITRGSYVHKPMVQVNSRGPQFFFVVANFSQILMASDKTIYKP